MTSPSIVAVRAGIIVTTKTPARATERRFSIAAYLYLYQLLEHVKLPVSGHFNARHDLITVVCVLVAMCESSRFVTTAIESLGRRATGSKEGGGGEDDDDDDDKNVPSARWFMGLISSVDYETMLTRAGRMFAKSVQMMVERGMIPLAAKVALDMTEYPYLGKEHDKIARGGRSKGGATRFETYATAAIASLPYLPHIAIRPVHKGDDLAACVRAMLGECLRLGISIDLLLLDRGFYSAAVMEVATRLHIFFIMPVPMQPPISRAVAEFKSGKRKAVSRYTVNAKKGSKGRPYEYTLIIVKRFKIKGGRRRAVYLTFATNMSVKKAWAALHRIPSEYKKRWAIETGYRTVNETRARTKSNSLSARLFLFYFSMTALNVLAICNYEADTERTRAGLLERARNGRERRAAARARGRGRKRKKWQHSWRNVLTRHGMFEWMRIVADRMLRLDAAGRADLLARLAGPA